MDVKPHTSKCFAPRGLLGKQANQRSTLRLTPVHTGLNKRQKGLLCCPDDSLFFRFPNSRYTRIVVNNSVIINFAIALHCQVIGSNNTVNQ